MPGSVILAGARTPIGKLSGALAGFSAMDLGGFAIAAALERAGVSPDDVDYVFMGQVLQAGQGQITARQAAVKGGIPMSVPATTINKVCLSGLNSIYLADLLIAAGEADIVVAGGMESMTQAPYLLPGARAGYRAGDGTLVDSMMYDGLYCQFDHCAMGLGTEQYNRRGQDLARTRRTASRRCRTSGPPPPSRTAASPTRSSPVSVPQRKGDPVVVDTDEGVRPGTTAESLGALKPAFDKEGTITAGNASQISDGGAAVVVTSRAKAECARRHAAGRGRELRAGGRAPTPRSCCNRPTPPCRRSPRWARRPGRGPVRDQRGLRRGGPGLDGRARHHRRGHQRQRRGHRPRPPHRHVGHAPGAHPAATSCAGAAAGSAPPACAAAAARATRSSCAR